MGDEGIENVAARKPLRLLPLISIRTDIGSPETLRRMRTSRPRHLFLNRFELHTRAPEVASVGEAAHQGRTVSLALAHPLMERLIGTIRRELLDRSLWALNQRIGG